MGKHSIQINTKEIRKSKRKGNLFIKKSQKIPLVKKKHFQLRVFNIENDQTSNRKISTSNIVCVRLFISKEKN